MNSYNNEKIFNTFLIEREDKNSPFNLQVKPTMLKFMGELKNKNILDLGCGMGHFAKELHFLDAKKIIGIDISEKEIEYANKYHKESNIEYKILDAQNINSLNQKFDIVSSGIVVDYIEDFDSLLKSINDCLVDNGLFVFSQVHPLSTAPKEKRKWLQDNNCNHIYQLSDYSFEGKREMSYFEGTVTMYHRTLSTIINAILKNNFEILEMSEPIPSKEELEIFPDRIKNLHKPSFLIFKLRKKS